VNGTYSDVCVCGHLLNSHQELMDEHSGVEWVICLDPLVGQPPNGMRHCLCRKYKLDNLLYLEYKAKEAEL
jgi:hypothetical protein